MELTKRNTYDLYATKINANADCITMYDSKEMNYRVPDYIIIYTLLAVASF